MTLITRTPATIKLCFACVAIIISISPFAAVTHLPLVDYPNHLARFYIYQNLGTNPYLSSFYEWHWAIQPTLALDVLILPLARFMPIEPAANLLVMLSLVALYAGTIALDRQLHGKDWGVSIFSGVILYNGALRMGFINYVIGVSFAILLLTLWFRLRPRLSSLTLLIFTVAGGLLLMAHLYAFGIYAICVAGSELARLLAEPRPFRVGPWRKRIKLVGVGLSLLAPASLLALSPASTDATLTRWSSLTWKIEAVVSPIFFDQPEIELPLLLIVVAIVGAGLLLRIFRVSSSMLPALGIFAVLLVVMPRMLYGSNYADYRLLSGIGFFFVASLQFTPRSPDWRAPTIVAACVCLIVRVGSILSDWIPAQAVLAEYETALVKVPPGSKLLVLLGSIGSTSANRSPPLEHVPVFAAARQGVFVGYTFAGPSNPLKIRPEFRVYEQFAPYPSLATQMEKFSHVLTLYEPEFSVPAGLSLLPIGRGRSYSLSKVIKSGS